MLRVTESSGRLRSHRTSQCSWTAGRQTTRSTTNRFAGEDSTYPEYRTLYHHVLIWLIVVIVLLCTECLLCGAMLERLLVVRQAAGRLRERYGRFERPERFASPGAPPSARPRRPPFSPTTATSPISTRNNTPRTSGILLTMSHVLCRTRYSSFRYSIIIRCLSF